MERRSTARAAATSIGGASTRRSPLPSSSRARVPEANVLPRPKKRFGQHFLTDRHYLERIVAAIDPHPHDAMVEIGPGTGLLTQALAEKVDRLHVVEIDRGLA